MSSLVLKGISKRFGTVDAVSGVDLRVEDGELLTLVGPSGCGKTTTLKLIAGLESPTAGTIQIGDRCVDSLEARHRNVAMVFQDDALQPHMTIARNLSFGLQMRAVPRAEIQSRVGEMAERFGIQEWLERMPHQLSGGQRQRVAVARSLIRSPDVLLFDEPLSNLDAPLRAELRTELARRRNEFTAAVVYVTHDQQEALALADRVAVMRDGRLEQVGSPQQIYQHPANRFVARFLGGPPINMLLGKVDSTPDGWEFCHDSIRIGLGEAEEKEWRTGQTVWLGIRPEHLRPPRNAEPVLTGSISMLQYLGSETLVEFQVGEAVLVARLFGESQLVEGDSIRLGIEPRKCLVFDADTEARIA